MSVVTAFSGSVHLPVDGIVVMQGLAVQTFVAGTHYWGFTFLIDGIVCVETGSRQASQDLVPIYARRACTGAPRDIAVEVRWSGDPTTTLQVCDAYVLAFPNTSN